MPIPWYNDRQELEEEEENAIKINKTLTHLENFYYNNYKKKKQFKLVSPHNRILLKP